MNQTAPFSCFFIQRIILPSLLILLTSGYLQAESNTNQKRPSLEQLQKSKPFEKTIEIANNFYYEGKLEEAIQFYTLAYNIERKSKHPKAANLGRALSDIGYCHYDLGHYHISIDWYLKSLEAFIEANDSIEISSQHCNIASAYFYLGKFEESIRYYKYSLEIDEKRGDSINIAINLNNLGKVFHAWKQYDKAIEFFEKALQTGISTNDSVAIATRLSNMATSYAAMGQHQSALHFFKQAYHIDSTLNNKQRLPGRLDQLGLAYQNLQNLQQAEHYFLEALSLLKKQTNEKTEAIVHNNLATNFLLAGNTQKATQHFNVSLMLASRLGLSQTILSNFQGISSLYEKTGELKKSKEFLEKYIHLKDSIFTASSQQTLNEFHALYETEKKDFEIKQLNADKEVQTIQIRKTRQQRLFFLILTISFLLLALLLYYMFNDRKKNARILDAKNKELHILNSTKDKFISILAHDLKNPFTAFRNITTALNENLDTLDKEEIKYYIEELSQSARHTHNMLMNMLDWATIQLKPTYSHLEPIHVKANIEKAIAQLEQLAKSKQINIEHSINKDCIAAGNAGALDIILNNVLTNAIKFSPPQSTITIRVNQPEDKVHIQVADNGRGIAPDDLKKLFRIDADTRSIGSSEGKGTGLGLILCKELALKMNGDILIESIFGQGTTVTLTLQSENIPQNGKDRIH